MLLFVLGVCMRMCKAHVKRFQSPGCTFHRSLSKREICISLSLYFGVFFRNAATENVKYKFFQRE